ncbi:DUF2250 domain-containing protein [Desulfoscipio geothermicus]|uniref:DUF2250 domain-containing protein n=1 Tax=Desulfoscipio geothermicus DSM 3669 TaxID=1121426 RepID=A0A1I6DYB4_9FIRM|nr:DUF2250 domain-containing protein [Desulfoscipio geothermicus]SFR10514.1 Uncharacterized protein SAMN05660706_12127 [Desulfoscipio geothermicus DSM 3669]
MKGNNNKTVLNWDILEELDFKLLEYLYNIEADCAKFISRKLKINLGETMQRLKHLEKLGFLERVKGTFLKRKDLYKPKHMNHTYYKLVNKARLVLKHKHRER